MIKRLLLSLSLLLAVCFFNFKLGQRYETMKLTPFFSWAYGAGYVTGYKEGQRDLKHFYEENEAR